MIMISQVLNASSILAQQQPYLVEEKPAQLFKSLTVAKMSPRFLYFF